MVLTAKWTANTYTVNFAYDSATAGNSRASDTYTTGSTPITLPIPTRTGYNFSGWYVDSALNTAISSDTYTVTGETLISTIYAKWTIAGFDIIFDEQLGTSVSDLSYNTDFRRITLPSATRVGYTLRGWYTAATGGTRIGGAGTSYTIPGGVSGNLTYYAQWSIRSFLVSFNNNNSTGGSVPNAQSALFGSSVVIRSNSGGLVRTGYTFGGWSTSSSYGAGDTYTAGVSTYTFPGQNVVLYAIWIPNPVTITFLPNGGSGSMSAQSTFSGLQTLNNNNFVLPVGKSSFGGWSLTPGENGARVDVANQITLTGNITLYARWL